MYCVVQLFEKYFGKDSDGMSKETNELWVV